MTFCQNIKLLKMALSFEGVQLKVENQVGFRISSISFAPELTKENRRCWPGETLLAFSLILLEHTSQAKFKSGKCTFHSDAYKQKKSGLFFPLDHLVPAGKVLSYKLYKLNV